MPNWFTDRFETLTCTLFNFLCGNLFELVASKSDKLDNLKRFPVIMGHYPAGTSVMNMVHWM